jgi:hypothetical protein
VQFVELSLSFIHTVSKLSHNDGVNIITWHPRYIHLLIFSYMACFGDYLISFCYIGHKFTSQESSAQKGDNIQRNQVSIPALTPSNTSTSTSASASASKVTVPVTMGDIMAERGIQYVRDEHVSREMLSSSLYCTVGCCKCSDQSSSSSTCTFCFVQAD